jgi:hypothetical protein
MRISLEPSPLSKLEMLSQTVGESALRRPSIALRTPCESIDLPRGHDIGKGAKRPGLSKVTRTDCSGNNKS